MKRILKKLSARLGRTLLLVALLAVAIFALYLDFRVRDAFEGRRFALPARVYARPLELYPGARVGADAVESELRWLGYRAELAGDEPGRYERRGSEIDLIVRPFQFWDGAQPLQVVQVRFRAGQVEAVRVAGAEATTPVRLDPMPIGGIYPAHNEDRALVRLADVPLHLVQALYAIEDRQFENHIGVDPRGLARAVVSTVSGRGVQGGSTLTQQLVKNFFLTPERTLTRKGTEILMALLLELHYGKEEILETYLNEIYLGQDRSRAIHGVGLAAQFYFGKNIAELSVAESALLVGMVKGPSIYDPHRHAAKALERRNLVLSEMKNQSRISLEEYTRARAQPIVVNDKPGLGTTLHPAFLDLVRRQLRRDYHDDDLRSEGLRIFTTLDPHVQRSGERALTQRLAALDKGKSGEAPLEGAVIVTSVAQGEVLALIGGRHPRYEGFNRALDARRPVGSVLKPAIFLTALALPERYTLITPLDDSPFTWKSRGAKDWTPNNYDKTNHGKVPLRLALAHSYNVASARLGTEIGISRVLDTVRALGVEQELPAFASSLLGAVDLAPLEVAQMYQTMAAGGFRTPLRAIREVVSADGKPLSRYPLAVEAAVPGPPTYLLTRALQDVVREGTAQGLSNWLPRELNVAGKTGTTDELRDSWFAGFTGDRVAVVWVGYDDNRSTKLTGSSGAMTVWGEMMKPLEHEPLVPPMPEGVEAVLIDPASGLLADRGCAGAVEMPFSSGSAPKERASCAASVGGRIKSWFRSLFE